MSEFKVQDFLGSGKAKRELKEKVSFKRELRKFVLKLTVLDLVVFRFDMNVFEHDKTYTMSLIKCERKESK